MTDLLFCMHVPFVLFTFATQWDAWIQQNVTTAALKSEPGRRLNVQAVIDQSRKQQRLLSMGT